MGKRCFWLQEQLSGRDLKGSRVLHGKSIASAFDDLGTKPSNTYEVLVEVHDRLQLLLSAHYENVVHSHMSKSHELARKLEFIKKSCQTRLPWNYSRDTGIISPLFYQWMFHRYMVQKLSHHEAVIKFLWPQREKCQIGLLAWSYVTWVSDGVKMKTIWRRGVRNKWD